MSDVTKFLMDDHRRLRRLLLQNPAATPDAALDICDDLIMHANIEEEILYPALQEVDATLAEQSEAEHEELKELISEIEGLDPEDHNELMRLMGQIKLKLENHIQKEEREVFPKLNVALADQLVEMGSAAFAMRQEMLGQRPDRDHSPPRLALTGWGKRNVRVQGTADAGWG